MKTIEEFLSYLCSLDVKLWLEEDRLRCSAPQNVLTPIIKEQLSERKAEILVFLRNHSADIIGKQQTIEPVKRQENLDLSFAQQRLWFLAQLEPGSAFYNAPAAVRLEGQLNVEALQQSFNEIISRHEILRTNFPTREGQPVAVILEEQPVNLSLPILDISHLGENQQQAEIKQQLAQAAEQPFDISSDRLLRIKLLRLSQQEHIVLLTMHHIISDGWSIGVFVEELAKLYQAFSNGKPSPLLPLPIQYVDFAAWQRQWLQGEILETQISYWLKQLENTPKLLELPTDYPRPAIQRFQGATYSFDISKELSTALNKFSQQQGSTLFMTLLAAFQTLLWRYTGSEDIVVGSPIANRNRAEIEGLIGFFVNTLVLRSNFTGNPSFEELLKRVREVALEAFAHQDLPFELLVEKLQPQRDLSHTPLFQVMFILQNAFMSTLELPGLTLTPLKTDTGNAQFDLTLSIAETESGLTANFEYNTDLFAESSIQRMANHLQTLLEAIVTNPQHCLSDLAILSKFEQHQLLREWNDTKVDYPLEKCIHQLFEEQVQRIPDTVAVEFTNQQLTYNQLNQKANQLAHHLQKLGVKADTLVGICVERSLEMIIGLLAILKAGGAYIPLDPSYPGERLTYMLEDSQTSILLSQQHLVEKLANDAVQVICLDSDWQTIATQSTENLNYHLHPHHLAYVIYTSGSTGKPKGAMNTHQGITNRLLWMQDTYKLTATDKVLQKTPFGFDVSVWEFFWTLISGACLVIAEPGGHQDSAYLVQLIQQQQITTVHFVPSMLQVFLDEVALENCQHLKRVICSGEALPWELQEKFFGRFLDVELHNLYGPTEAAIDVTYWQCQRHNQEKVVPIGRAIANTEIYILDPHLQPVPIGVPGELHIAGVGLACGYLHRPQLTNEKFIPNPFDLTSDGRLYKTGDLARYREDGNIEYLGRIDDQVKLRGLRIELGEIAAILQQFPKIQQAVVVVREDTPGNQRLVAYIVPRSDSAHPQTQELRDFLLQKLPQYMIPYDYVLLDTLPLTPNGKLDRRALPMPEITLEAEKQDVLPRTPVEEKLVKIWMQVLDLPKIIGIYDNFFELGGHSLLATQVISQTRQAFQVELSIHRLFEMPTIAEFAQEITRILEQKVEQSLITPQRLDRQTRRVKLSSLQQVSRNLQSESKDA
ncbi:non-ribosomal peptide synthetase [Calothrix sp. PCC 6303]|uniref:non-ribosomal peptide synthetase n=1 Tax=Calothrix sp. PCC 6303 TaxID=1170562 RepID=UPI0002A04158|nr:non-ribosomal peptide synthetase [Calothrix sp. PCC 6303]AFZ01579.1 amino acid adenylation domain protein [Calothrix sp. PCC 6303]